MRSFKSSNLSNSKRLFSSSSSSSSPSSISNTIYNHIDSFLSNRDLLDSQTLLPTHAFIITTGHSHNRFIASKLIQSYASLNQPHSSTKLFHSLFFKDPFLWNSIIKAHFSNGNYHDSLLYFSKMRSFGALPNQFTLPMVVSACAELGLRFFGMSVHGLVFKLKGFDGNSAVGSSFVYMYSKCGDVWGACKVFDEIPVRDVVSWTALVIGFVQNGEDECALECLCEMHGTGGDEERPNWRTLEGGFQACGNLNALVEGRCLHGFAVKSGLVSSHVVRSGVLSMYSKCGSVEDACVSFCEVVAKDLFSWTSIIGLYARLGCWHECFEMFSQMLANGVHPDGIVISCFISGFSNSMKIAEGKAFHGFILRRPYGIDKTVSKALLSMYCKFGLLSVAEKIFDGGHNQEKDSWHLMVVGYEKAGLEMNCIKLFREMQYGGIESDLNSLMSVMSSCSRLEAISFGQSIHCHIIKNLLFGNNITLVNSLINMYGKFGNLTVAQKLFDRTLRGIATWNSLISSYAQNGKYSEALTIFDDMVGKGLKPTAATLLSVLSACAHIASIEKGKIIHNFIREERCEESISIATALVDMYGKCGQIKMAREVFDSMTEKDVVSWNVMISCYGMHGYGESAIEIFELMEHCGCIPNDLTFLALLSACAHTGLVDKGKKLFEKMKEYSLIPSLKHYACMVDLLGRSGCLQEAEDLILSMPMAPDGGLWGSLLTACKWHNNVEMGIRIANRAMEADPENDGYYVIISDLYSSIGIWEEVGRVRNSMKDRGVRKAAGWSSV